MNHKVVHSSVLRLLIDYYGPPDDHFPPISDILGLIPKSPRNNVSSSSRSFIPTHIRAPLRATTYDGNAIYIGRKRYVGTTQKVRCVCIPFLHAHCFQTFSAPTRLSNLLDVPIHRLKDELLAASASKSSLLCVSFDSVGNTISCVLAGKPLPQRLSHTSPQI
jgi:hypothetical protein